MQASMICGANKVGRPTTVFGAKKTVQVKLIRFGDFREF
jgi:hypothetical protein